MAHCPLMFVKRIIYLLLATTILLNGCVGTMPNPVSLSQFGDDTKSCDAVFNEMQAMILTQNKAEDDQNTQIGKNLALGVAGIFALGIPWYLMDFSGASTTEQKAAQARFERLKKMQQEKDCSIDLGVARGSSNQSVFGIIEFFKPNPGNGEYL